MKLFHKCFTFLANLLARLLRKITVQKKADTTELDCMAYYDYTTGLPSRLLFFKHLAGALQDAKHRSGKLALLFINLDGFKKVNDSLGHDEGDRLLALVGDRIREAIRKTDNAARLGGDEFAVLLPHVNNKEAARHVAEKIIDITAKLFHLDEQKIHLTASIGIALYPEDGEDEKTLLKNANSAMCRAKEDGKNRYCSYIPAMRVNGRKLALEDELYRAVEQEEFLLYYQPRVNSKSGECTGFEALLRWNHPERGILSPAEFLPVLEETGLIVPLSAWILTSACRQNKKWQQDGFPPLGMAVNISALSFMQGNLVNIVDQVLSKTKLAPCCLELEITENMAIQDINHAIKTMQLLQEKGIKVALDDFGTGYSSLVYLIRFALDILKIDRSFIRNMDKDPNSLVIVETIIAMAKSLKLKTVAEGVAKLEQVELLKEKECEELQGFYFCPPLPPQEVEQMFSNSTYFRCS